MSSKNKSLTNQKKTFMSSNLCLCGIPSNFIVFEMAEQLLDLVISITIACNCALAFYHKQNA